MKIKIKTINGVFAVYSDIISICNNFVKSLQKIP